MLLACIFGSAKAHAQGDAIVEYTFGNQIFGSKLVVQSDGTVRPQERICCPPQFKDQEAQKLSEGELSNLNHLIDLAANLEENSGVEANDAK